MLLDYLDGWGKVTSADLRLRVCHTCPLYQKVKVKVKVKVNVDLYRACREHTSKVLRYGMRSQRISQFYLHTPCSSANELNHTCLCLPS